MSRNDVEVYSVSSPSEFSAFIELPYILYRDDPYWVPPLRRDQRKLLDRNKHPFYEHGAAELLLARDSQGRVVGRIAAIHNHLYVDYHDEPTGFFGFFECINDPSVASALFSAAGGWLANRGMNTMQGPVHYSLNDECGLLVDGFDGSPYILMLYNPPYYRDLYEGAGLTKAKDLLAYWGDHATVDANAAQFDRWRRVAKRTKQRHSIRTRIADMSNFAREVETIKVIYNRAWTENWGFVPLTDGEIDLLANDLKLVIDPELVHFAYDGEEPIGVLIAVPDYNQVLRHMDGRLWPFGILKLLWYQRKIDRLRSIALGIVGEWQKRGIAPILIVEAYDRARRRSYKEGELSWVLEDNHLMNNSIENLGFELYKRYRIYQQAL